MSNLKVEIYDSINDINKNQWNNIVEQSNLGSFFHRYDWIKSIEHGRGLAVPYPWETWHEILVLDDDMTVVAGTDLIDYNMNLTLAVFDLHTLQWGQTVDWILIGAIAGVVAVVDVIVVIALKYRKPPSAKKKVDLDDVFDEIFEKG